jgi:hypothetical protein
MESPLKRARAASDQDSCEQVAKPVKRRRVPFEVLQPRCAPFVPLNADVNRLIGSFMEPHEDEVKTNFKYTMREIQNYGWHRLGLYGDGEPPWLPCDLSKESEERYEEWARSWDCDSDATDDEESDESYDSDEEEFDEPDFSSDDERVYEEVECDSD